MGDTRNGFRLEEAEEIWLATGNGNRSFYQQS